MNIYPVYYVQKKTDLKWEKKNYILSLPLGLIKFKILHFVWKGTYFFFLLKEGIKG